MAKAGWAKLTATVSMAALLGVAMVTAPAQAADDPSLISLSVGMYDQHVVDPGIIFLKGSSDHRWEAVDYRGEYRFGKSLLPMLEPYAKLKPWVGFEGTSDGAIYGLGGILFDIPLGPIVFTPSFGAGLYSSGGGKNLGAPVEFRTMIEVGYQFDNASRFSLGYSHISNAGITQLNPGANMISVYYHLPANLLFGN
ncbi:lipid A 3-O-deacylase [uncultured Gammaproteobacteria bacterium]